MRLQGQTFGTDIVARIRTTISEDLETTRSGLSRQLCEWFDWYAVRWGHRGFSPHPQERHTHRGSPPLADAGNFQACLALDMVVSWRVLYLTHLGRQTLDVPCDLFFEEDE